MKTPRQVEVPMRQGRAPPVLSDYRVQSWNTPPTRRWDSVSTALNRRAP